MTARRSDGIVHKRKRKHDQDRIKALKRRDKTNTKKGKSRLMCLVSPKQRCNIPFVLQSGTLALPLQTKLLKDARTILESQPQPQEVGGPEINPGASKLYLSASDCSHVAFIDFIVQACFDNITLASGEILVEGINTRVANGLGPGFQSPSSPWLLEASGPTHYHSDIPVGKAESCFSKYRSFFQTLYVVLDLQGACQLAPPCFKIFRIQRNKDMPEDKTLELYDHEDFPISKGLFLKFESIKLHGVTAPTGTTSRRLIFNMMYFLKSQHTTVVSKYII